MLKLCCCRSPAMTLLPRPYVTAAGILAAALLLSTAGTTTPGLVGDAQAAPQRLQLRLGGRNRPGIGLAAHAGAGEGHGVAVAPPSVGRQVHAVGVQAIQAAIAADDRVV